MSDQDNHDLASAAQQTGVAIRTDEMTLVQSVSAHGLLAHGTAAVIAAITISRSVGLTPVLIWLICMLCAIAIRYMLYIASLLSGQNSNKFNWLAMTSSSDARGASVSN